MNNIKEITVKDVLDICGGELICGNLDMVLENFCQDTRLIKTGDVYVGIKGENHNGNDIYEDALQKGAKACILQGIIVPENVIEIYKDRVIILVDDTIRALQKIATYKRSMFDIPVVAVTGSVGKTSTKDIIASVMSKEYNVLKTEGNYNSQLGVALTVLRLRKEHTAMVIELGMSQLGEISRLTNIVKPNVAVITNVGTAHIGILGSRENILKAKLEIIEGLQSDGKLVINNDNDLLHNWCINSNRMCDVVTYGMENESDVMAYNTVLTEDGSTYNVDVEGKTYKVQIGIGGNHFVSNSLCAIAVGRILNIEMENILDGIAHFELTKRRMQVEKLANQVTVINDCYNANYDSMKAAIEYLSKLENGKKIAVLGDMLELGDYSESLHRQVGEVVSKNNIDILITVGDEAKYIGDEACKNGMDSKSIYTFDTNEEAIEKLKSLIENGNIGILIKASNGMHFQEIFNEICVGGKYE